MATYYVRPTNGSDANAGTSFAAAFQTTQKGVDTATAGDLLLLCNEGTETVTAATNGIFLDQRNGTDESPIVVEGRDGTDGSTADTYTIQATGTWATEKLMVRFAGFGAHMRFKDIVFDANGKADACFDDNKTVDDGHALPLVFVNCRFTGSDDHGYETGYLGLTRFINCEFDNNDAEGFNAITASSGLGEFEHCLFHDNGTIGCVVRQAYSRLDHCQLYANGADGLRVLNTCHSPSVINCVAYGNTGSGFRFFSADTNGVLCLMCSSVDNTTYGFAFDAAGDVGTIAFMDFNHTHNNTSGATNLTDGMPGGNNVSGDPLFVSTTPGSENFTPNVGSPLTGAGFNSTDIGPRKGLPGICRVPIVFS